MPNIINRARWRAEKAKTNAMKNIGETRAKLEIRLKDVESYNDKYGWESCPTDDPLEEKLCKKIKKSALRLLENPHAVSPLSSQDLDEPWVINFGYCRVTICDLEKFIEIHDEIDVINGSVGRSNHWWIRYNGKHYDAEVPSGVERAVMLPTFDERADELRDDEYTVEDVVKACNSR